MVELELAESFVYERVRQMLKNGMTNRKINYWVIFPQADEGLVAPKEAVLDIYAQPYGPSGPVL